MKIPIRYTVPAFMLLAGAALGGTLPLVDSAFVRSGSQADTPQAWGSALALKNAGGNYCRIAMMKADISSATQVVDSATFTVYAKDAVPHTIYVYGVRDSAGFQDWTGGDTGTATWNSVSGNGLFQPLENLYQTGHSNLVLLGSQTLPGANTGDVQVAVSGSELVNLLNTDTDGLLTFVFATDANLNGIAIRPHTHANAPSLEFTYAPPAPPRYPRYPRVGNLLTNNTPYDLAQETYQFEELWRIPKAANTNMLTYMGKTPIVSRGTDTFMVYVDPDFRPVVTRIDTNGTIATAYIDTTLYQPSEFYINSGVARHYTARPNDGHHNFSIGMDRDGFLHIVGDMHNYPRYAAPMDHLPLRYHSKHILYWRSDKPYDISSFTFHGDQAAQCPQGYGFTYASFFNDWNGELYMGSRAMQASSKRCIAVSRYNELTGLWSVVGGTIPGEEGYPRFFYEDASRIPGTYSKTSLASLFDRNNNMHCSAPTVGFDIVYPEIPGSQYSFHHTTHILYARSDDGGSSFLKADGTTPIAMPARVAAGANQADIVYAAATSSPTNCSEFINTRVSLATDYRDVPFVEMQEKFTNSTPDTTYIMEWDSTSGNWIKHTNPAGAGGSDFILHSTPEGVLNWIADDNSKMYRFWNPTNAPVLINLPWKIQKLDAEYSKQTGNILGVAATSTDIIIAKVSIDRPGLELIEQPTLFYPQWTDAYGLTGSNTLHSADPDFDGINNLAEYALGGDPLVDDAAAILPQGLLEGGFLNYIYQRRLEAAARGLTYDVLVSTNLVDGVWSNTSTVAGTAPIDAEFEAVTNRLPTAAEPQQFIKLEVGINE